MINVCRILTASTHRFALINVAHNTVKYKKTFKDYYYKKAESKYHYNALDHCAGKLVRVIYKMLTHNVVFNLDSQLIFIYYFKYYITWDYIRVAILKVE